MSKSMEVKNAITSLLSECAKLRTIIEGRIPLKPLDPLSLRAKISMSLDQIIFFNKVFDEEPQYDGDSLPYPNVTIQELDQEMDDYWKQ